MTALSSFSASSEIEPGAEIQDAYKRLLRLNTTTSERTTELSLSSTNGSTSSGRPTSMGCASDERGSKRPADILTLC